MMRFLKPRGKQTTMNSQPKLWHYIDLIIVLFLKEMKVRYKSTSLGYLWSVLHPLAFAFVFFMETFGIVYLL